MNLINLINLKIYTPYLEISDGYIVIEENKIKEVGYMKEYINNGNNKELDFKGYIAIPGLIDTHFHGSNGYDFMDGTEDALTSIAKYRIKEGVTCIYPTTVSESFERTKKAIKTFVSLKNKKFSEGARLLGIHLEGPYISIDKKGAQNEIYIRNIDIKETEKLIEESDNSIKMISYAPELKNAQTFTEFLIENNIQPSMAHTKATFEDIQKCYISGLRHATHLFNGMAPLHHREIGPVGTSLLYDDIYIEVIVDKIHISPSMLKLLFKIKNPEYIILITDAIRAQGLKDGTYELGGQKVIVKGREARLANGSLAGSTLFLNEAIKNLKEETDLPLTKIISMVTINPAKFMKIEDKFGSIEPGKIADIIITDNDFKIHKVFKEGEIIFEN